MTAVDIAAGNAVAADDDDSVNAVVPPSSTKGKDAYVGGLVAFEGAAAAADVALSRCPHHRSLRAAATALPPLRCAPPPRFALLPLLLTLPPLRHRRQAAANVALLRCCHRRCIRAAATALPPSRCAPPPRFTLPPPPLTLPP
jgi:hypothetical protein